MGTTTSFNNTPQATDDIYKLTEDARVTILDVMANDLGGNAKTLFSLDDGLTSSNTIGATDLLTADIVNVSERSAKGARISMTADGKVSYDLTGVAAFQQLAAGETAEDSFIYAIRLGNGTLSWARAIIQIAGVNDAHQIVSVGTIATGAITEMAGQAASSTLDTASGTIVFSDVDLKDTHAANAAAPTFTWSGGTLSGAQSAALQAAGTLDLKMNDSTNTGTGSVGWTYSAQDQAFDFLAQGQTLTVTYKVSVADKNGGAVTQDVVITITGTNDTVSITNGAQAGSVNEDSTTAHTATGTIAFTDADLSDTHAATFAAAAGNTTSLGKFELASVAEAANAADGSVGWTYTLDDSKAQYLAAGEQVTETYTVTVDDGHGSTTTRDVVITITGTNDVVSITSGVQAGSVAEDSTTAHMAGGTIAFTDADLKDGHTAAVTASPSTVLGTFALASVNEAANAADGSVGWTYTLDDSKAQYLAAGEQVNETYTVTVDDGHGSTTTQDVVITITGTNDVVSITSGVKAGSVAEDSTTAHMAGGTIAFTDADLKDGHTASVTASPSTSLGTFALASVAEAANAADGSVGWTYTLDDSKAQYLAAGQTATESFTVTVDDSHGGKVDQVVTVTITGTNDGPTINVQGTDAAGAVTEDAAATTLTDTGTIAFSDLDLTDTHTAMVAAAATNTLGGTLTLGAASESATTADGTIGWTYTVANSATQYLAAGQTATESFTVTVSDGHEGTVEQVVTVTITGTNDGPTINVQGTDAAGAVTEDAAATTLTDTGTIAFSDLDLIDTHTAMVAAAATNTLGGTLALGAASESATTADGTIGWTYTVANSATQYLAAGQTATETFTVTVDDHHGGTVDQVVTVTLTGTNDGPTINVQGTDAVGAVTEDAAAPTLTDTGTIAFGDLDLIDTHTATVAAAGSNTLGGTLALGAAAESATTADGSIGWTYTVANSATQYLAAGQTATESFTVTVSDGHDGTVEQVVTVTITGTNDGPTINVQGTDAVGSVTEDAAAPTLTDTGTIAFNDLDLVDTHTATVAAAGSNTLGGTLTLGAAAESVTTADGTIGWTYTVANSATQYLAAGQTATETFTVTVDDHQGGTVEQVVTVTVTGTNDGPTITAAATDAIGAVTEDAAATTLTDTGTIAFSDLDLVDTHTATVTAAGGNTLGGTLTLDAAAESATTADGTIGWTYAVTNSATQYLAAGQTATETFTVTVSDGHDGTVEQVVTVTVTGTNDGPTITAAATDAIGAVTEDAAAPTLTDTGTIAFSDLDLVDTHTATVAAAGSNTLGGTLALGAAAESATTADGTIGWTYAVANSATQYLAAGQTVTESFTVTVDDHHGGTVDQVVTVTVTGTNDAPVITSAAVNQTIAETNAALTSSGAIAFTDADHNAVDTAAVAGTPVVTASAGLTLTAAQIAAFQNAFTVGADGHWNFNLASPDYLAAGESVQVDYTVMVTDDKGATATQVQSITVTGTNDAPVITSAAVNQTIAETNAALTSSGAIAFTDADHNAVDTAAVAGTPVVTPSAGLTLTAAQTAAFQSAFTVGADGHWNFNLASPDYLAAGESVQVDYTVMITDDKGATATQVQSITVTGTNDAPVITSAAVNQTIAETNAALTSSGVITFTDADHNAVDTAAVAGTPVVTASAGLSLTTAQIAAFQNAFTVGADGHWNFNLASPDYLAAGESVQVDYTVTVIDDKGATATQVQSITVTGTNDAPVITSAAVNQTIAETNAALTSSGAIAFTDADHNAVDTAAVAGTPVVTASAGLTLTAAQIAAFQNAFTVGADGHWNFNLASPDYLAAGESVKVDYTVRVIDDKGATATQVQSITVTGTNDAPVITSAAVNQTIAETNAALTSSGAITFTDADHNAVDTAAVTGTPVVTASAGLTLTAAQIAAFQNAFTVGADGHWNFNLASPDYLAAGESVKVDYTVGVTDDKGATATQVQTITVTGTNDAPVITSAAVNQTIAETNAALTSSGAIAFTDADHNAVDTAAVAGTPVVTASAGLSLTTAQIAAFQNAFTVGADGHWNFNLASPDYLAAGESVKVDYTVRVTDDKGATATQVQSITVTGTNDAPVLDNSKTPVLANVSASSGVPTGAVGTLVSNLVDSTATAGGLDNVTDADTGAALGIALTATSGGGTWYYTTNGGTTWASVNVTGTSALLLAADTNTRLFFQSSSAGTGTITFRAWDQTSGTAGSRADTSANGGTSAFSTATDNAGITVTPNTPPDTTPPQLSSISATNLSNASGAQATVTFTFSEKIDSNTFTLDDIAISDTNRVTLSNLQPKAGDPLTWTATATRGSANGSYTLTVATGAFKDLAGNVNTASYTSSNLAPAGVAGEPISLALSAPATDQGTTYTITVSEMPSDWVLSAGSKNPDGTWTVVTNDPGSLTVTTPSTFTGAVVLNISEAWTTVDGGVDMATTTSTVTVSNNVEAYAPGNPIFAVSTDDNLTGSSAADLFVFAQPIARDTVYNFDTAADKIDLIGFTGVAGFSDLSIADDASGNAVITLANGSTITVVGVHAAALTANNFAFNVEPVSTNTGTLTLSDGAIMPFGGVLNNSGTIELKSAGRETQLEVLVESLKLQGGGRVTLSDSDHNVIFGGAANAKLVNIDNTISGAGQIGAGQMTLDNHGIIVADGSHALTIDTGANTVANSGTLEATGAGGLVINSALANTGTLWANGGNVTVHGDVSGGGSAVISGASVLELDGVANVAVSFDAGGSGSLKLGDADHFSGSIAGFGGNDSLRLADIAVKAGSTLSFAAGASGGTLTVSDGTSTAHLALQGSYANAGFIASADQGGMLLMANVADANQNLHGTEGIDLLASGAGNDILAGGAGNDVLFGGGGSDTFVFDTVLNGASNVDTILDFCANGDADYIQLSQQIFGSLTGTGGTLDASQFAAVSDGSGGVALLDAGVHLIYDSQTGSLYYDANGADTVDGRTVVAVIGTSEHPSGAHITHDVFKFG